jgi:hypothetical protein
MCSYHPYICWDAVSSSGLGHWSSSCGCQEYVSHRPTAGSFTGTNSSTHYTHLRHQQQQQQQQCKANGNGEKAGIRGFMELVIVVLAIIIAMPSKAHAFQTAITKATHVQCLVKHKHVRQQSKKPPMCNA